MDCYSMVPDLFFLMKLYVVCYLEINVAETGGRVNPGCLKSNVKFPQSVMIWGATSSADSGSGPEPLLDLPAQVLGLILEPHYSGSSFHFKSYL